MVPAVVSVDASEMVLVPVLVRVNPARFKLVVPWLLVSNAQSPVPPMLALLERVMLEVCADPPPMAPPLLVRAPVPPTPVPAMV